MLICFGITMIVVFYCMSLVFEKEADDQKMIFACYDVLNGKKKRAN